LNKQSGGEKTWVKIGITLWKFMCYIWGFVVNKFVKQLKIRKYIWNCVCFI